MDVALPFSALDIVFEDNAYVPVFFASSSCVRPWASLAIFISAPRSFIAESHASAILLAVGAIGMEFGIGKLFASCCASFISLSSSSRLLLSDGSIE